MAKDDAKDEIGPKDGPVVTTSKGTDGELEKMGAPLGGKPEKYSKASDPEDIFYNISSRPMVCSTPNGVGITLFQGDFVVNPNDGSDYYGSIDALTRKINMSAEVVEKMDTIRKLRNNEILPQHVQYAHANQNKSGDVTPNMVDRESIGEIATEQVVKANQDKQRARQMAQRSQ